jgi:hypothetical protein
MNIEQFKQERTKAKMKLKEDKIRRHTEALERLQDRVKIKQIRESILADEIAKKMGVVVVTNEGVSHPLPPEEIIMPKDIQKELDYEFTPLTDYVIKKVGGSWLHYVPLVGFFAESIDMTNVLFQTGEMAKEIVKVSDIVTRLERGESDIDLKSYENVDQILKQRLPSITDLLDDTFKFTKYNVKEEILRLMKDKIIEGWDNERLSYEIARTFLGPGRKLGEESMQILGGEIWKKAFE